ncbi:MAG: tetratricopeptide repeat protein [Myxococcota bacterium]|nr:tetratricopeptide repeat protein [Myxococcota bacterium]
MRGAVEAAPSHWPALRALVTAIARSERASEAAAPLDTYVEHADDPLVALEQGAGLLDALGRRSDAVQLLERAVAEPDSPPGTELVLVRLLHKRRSAWGRRNQVLEAYEATVTDDVQASLAVGKLWVLYRHPNRAKAIGERLRARHPGRFEGGLLLADVMRAAGRRSSEKAVISQTVAAATEPQAAALAVGMRYLEWREHARAITWLETALVGRAPVALQREAHKGLIDALMGQHPPARRAAARHMRRWLALAPEEDKVASLEHLLQRTAGATALKDLRVDLLQEFAARRSADADVLEALGHALVGGMHWDMAAETFGRAVRQSATPREVTLRAGRAMLAAGQVSGALGFFERIELLPTELDVQTWRILGVHLYSTGHVDRADAYFAKLLERTASGGHLSELGIFGRAALRLGAWERAVQAAHQLLARREHHRDGMRMLGEALTRLERHEEAQEWFDRFIGASAPAQRAKGQLFVGELLVELGRLPAAAERFETALTEGGTRQSAALFEQLAATRRRMGDREGLLRSARLHVARADSPRSVARAALGAARALEQAGMHDEAWQFLSSALEHARTDRALLEAAAANAMERGDGAAAAMLYERLARQRGTSARVWQETSDKLTRAGYGDAAVKLLEAAVRRPGVPAALHVVLGRRLLEVGRMDEADAAFQRAVTHASSMSEVTTAVDEAYRAAGQLRRLEAFYVGLVATVPARTEPPLTLGGIRLELGDPDGAEQAFARYLASSPRGHLAVAQAYAEHGESERALIHYRRAWEQPAPGGSKLPLEKLAVWLAASGRPDRLEWFVNLHVRRARESGQAAREASTAYAAVGDVREALRWLREAAKLAPDPKHELVEGDLLLAAGDVDGARRAWASYIERRRVQRATGRDGRANSKRTMAEAAVEVAERWAQARRLDDAASTVRAAASRYGQTPLLVVTEARYLLRQGKVTEALGRVDTVTPVLRQAPIGATQALVNALRHRERDAELVALLAKADVANWNDDLGLVQLALLGDLERWDEAAQLAGVLTRSGKAEQDLAVGLQAFESGLFELAERHLRRALSRGLDQPLAATRALDAIRALRPRRSGESTSRDREVVSAVAPDDRLGELVLSAQRRADRRDVTGALSDALEALRMAPDDLRIFNIVLSLAVLSGDVARLEVALDTLRSRQHPRLTVLKSVVKRLALGLRPEMARRFQSEIIAAQPGIVGHHLVAVGLALQGGNDVAARWHTDAALALAGSEPGLLLQLAERWQRWLRSDAAEALLARLDGGAASVAVQRQMIRLRAALLAGDAKRAEAVVAEALRASGDDLRVRLRATGLALDLGALPELALGWMEPVMAAGPMTDRALAFSARVAWRNGDSEGARAHFAALTSMHRVDVSLWGGVLGAAVSAGDVEGLRQWVAHLPTRAAWTEPEVAVAGMASASLEYEAARMTPEARVAMADAVDVLIREATRQSPTAAAPLAAAAAVTAEVRGDLDGAVRAYEAPLMREPRSPIHANNLAYVLSRFGRDLDRALELVVTAQVRAGEPVMSYTDTEAWVRYRRGEYAAARRLMALTVHGAHQREDRAPSGQVEMLFHYGSTLDGVGEDGRAWPVWRDCARRDPISPYGRLCVKRFEAVRPRRGGGAR